MSQVELRIAGGAQMRKLTQALKEQSNGDIRREMRRNVRVAAKPVIVDLRRAVMSVEVTSTRHGTARPDTDTDLRRRVAGALTTSVTRTGVRIVVNGRKVGPYGGALSRYLDADSPRAQRWRHQVFGHDVWTMQQGQPWFFVTIVRHVDTFRRAVLRALDDAIDKLKG